MTITIDPRALHAAIMAELDDTPDHEHADWWSFRRGCARCELMSAAAGLENTIARMDGHPVPNAAGRAS